MFFRVFFFLLKKILRDIKVEVFMTVLCFELFFNVFVLKREHKREKDKKFIKQSPVYHYEPCLH
jgi:hypothetical protein